MELADAVLQGNRLALARAITLVESRRPEDEASADVLLQAVHGRGKDCVRVGISGPPGVGKSTFIDALGSLLTSQGMRVAVLAVDPSSSVSGGSILGDKTRMTKLSRDPSAFVRPSPGSGALGGVAPRTREAITVCEGAGYNVILVETVGVGQSEIAVASMVDFLLLLVPPDSGDELQGIKRGITEVADGVFVNKADGDRLVSAQRTRLEYEQALQLVHPGDTRPVVLAGSAQEGRGLNAVWQAVTARGSVSSPARAQRRAAQARRWLDEALHDQLVERFLRRSTAATQLAAAYREVEGGGVSPRVVARRLLASS